MDDDVIGGAPLGGKGRFDIGVADMLIAGGIKIERLGLSARVADGGGAGLLINRGHLAPRAIDPPCLAVIAGELDLVASFQFKRLRRKCLCRSSASSLAMSGAA